MPTPKTLANLICGPLLATSNKKNLLIDAIISQKNLVELADLFETKKINNQGVLQILENINLENTDSIEKIAQKLQVLQVSDTTVLAQIVETVIQNSPKQVLQYKEGKVQVLGFLVGACMKEAKGQGNAQLFGELLEKKLQ